MNNVNYPDGRKSSWNASLTSAGGRGMDLEYDINVTNEFYLSEDMAVIHKKPTPVTIVKVDYPKRSAARITEAYFKVPSTTDYNGIYKGRYLDFEAKECASATSFPLKSLHPHQITHLKNVLHHGAVAFLLIRFTKLDETYYVKAEDLLVFIKNEKRHSVPRQWFADNGFLVPYNYLKPVDYLKVVDRLIAEGD